MAGVVLYVLDNVVCRGGLHYGLVWPLGSQWPGGGPGCSQVQVPQGQAELVSFRATCL